MKLSLLLSKQADFPANRYLFHINVAMRLTPSLNCSLIRSEATSSANNPINPSALLRCARPTAAAVCGFLPGFEIVCKGNRAIALCQPLGCSNSRGHLACLCLGVGKDFRDRVDTSAGKTSFDQVCQPVVHIPLREDSIEFRRQFFPIGHPIPIGGKPPSVFHSGRASTSHNKPHCLSFATPSTNQPSRAENAS